MRRAVNVQLVVLSASVVFATSLVTPEWQGKQENPPGRQHRAPALVQSGKNALRRSQRQSGLAEASFKTRTARSEANVQQSGHKAAVAHHAAPTGHSVFESSPRLQAVALAQKSHPSAGNISHAAEEHADLLLGDILSGMRVPAFLPKTDVRASTSHSSVVKSFHSADSASIVAAPVKPVAALSVKRVHSTSGRKDGPLTDVFGRLARSRVSGRVGKFEAWESEFLASSRRQTVWRYAVKGFFSILLWAVLILLLGVFYHYEKQHPPKLDPEGVNVSLHDRERLDRQRWRFGLFECSEVPSLCVFSFLCAPLRWADTMRMAGFLNFFSALAIVVGLTVLGSLTLGVGFVALMAVFVHYRQRLRQKYDIRSHSCGSPYTTDVLAFVFCPWCSLVQEARQIEEAYLARHASVHHEYRVRQAASLRLAAVKV